MVDGGPTNNDWLIQYQADLLGCPVMRSDVPELSAIGAALLARKALHPGSTADLQAFLTEHSTFQPDMARHQRLQTRWQGGAMRSTEHYGNRTRQPDRQTARRHAFTYHRRNPAHNDIAIPEYIREISDRKSLPAQGLICSNIKIQEQSHEITYNPF